LHCLHAADVLQRLGNARRLSLGIVIRGLVLLAGVGGRLSGTIVRTALLARLTLTGYGRGQRLFTAVELGLCSLHIGIEIPPAQCQQFGPHAALVLFQSLVLLGIARLALQYRQALRHLADQVIQAFQIVTRVPQSILGFPAPLLVTRYARGLFQNLTHVVRLRFDEPIDRTLFDDGVIAAPAQAGAQKQVDHITPPCSRAVDEIARPAFTRHLAAYGNFGKAGILTAELAVRVVETQFDGSAAHRLAGLRAIENDVLECRSAQLLGAGLTRHPAHGIDDIGLAATVGADD